MIHVAGLASVSVPYSHGSVVRSGYKLLTGRTCEAGSVRSIISSKVGLTPVTAHNTPYMSLIYLSRRIEVPYVECI